MHYKIKEVQDHDLHVVECEGIESARKMLEKHGEGIYYILVDMRHYRFKVYLSGIDGCNQRMKIPSGIYAVFQMKKEHGYINNSMDFLHTNYRQDIHQVHFEKHVITPRSHEIKLYIRLRKAKVNFSLLHPLEPNKASQLYHEFIMKFTSLTKLDKDKFIWDHFKHYQLISYDTLLEKIKNNSKIYYFRDPFNTIDEKVSIFELDPSQLLDAHDFPSDYYLFDEHLTWTIAVTHESLNEVGHHCMLIDEK